MRFSRFLLPVLALVFVAAAKKPPVTVRFHLESSLNSGSEFTMTTTVPGSGRTICLSKVAEIAENDVAAIFPFPADDGTQGCAFKLDNHGRIILDQLSQQYRHSTLVGFVNARLVTAMLIDRRVSDGVIYIPRGIAPEEIALLSKQFPVLGETKKGKKSSADSEPVDNRKPDRMTGLLPPGPVPTPISSPNSTPIPVPPPLPPDPATPRGD